MNSRQDGPILPRMDAPRTRDAPSLFYRYVEQKKGANEKARLALLS